MTRNGGLTKGIVWWRNLKVGYGRHGFWHHPRENSKGKDMSHNVPCAAVANWLLAATSPFQGAYLSCLLAVPEGPSAAMAKSGQGARAERTPKELESVSSASVWSPPPFPL